MPARNQREITIQAYSDADYANDETSRKSITGMVTLINGTPVQWLVKQQPVVARSTCEAEYISASETAALTTMAAQPRPRNPTPHQHAHPACGQHSSGANGEEHGRDETEKMHWCEISLPPRHGTAGKTASTGDTINRPIRRHPHQTPQGDPLSHAQRKHSRTGHDRHATLASGECGYLQNQFRRSANAPRQQQTHGSLQTRHSHK